MKSIISLDFRDVRPGIFCAFALARTRSPCIEEDRFERAPRAACMASRVMPRRFKPIMLRPASSAWSPVCHAVGNDIGVHAGQSADHRAFSDTAELLHRRKAAEDDALSDMNMSGQRRGVGKRDVVPDMQS